MEEGEEEVEEEAEEDALGYLTLPLWLFDLLGGVRPLLQVGLSAPGGHKSKHRLSLFGLWVCLCVCVLLLLCTSTVQVCVAGGVAGAEAG